jgi:arginase
MAKSVDVIGVPLDFGFQELGLKLGPEAFRKAGLLDVGRACGIDMRDLGNLPVREAGALRTVEEQAALVAEHCEALAQMVTDSVRSGRTVVCLGGDHSLAIGSVAGASVGMGEIGCVWLDTHPDANTPETSPSGNIHGMPVAVILGRGPEPLLAVAMNGARIQPARLTVLGVRHADDGEVESLERDGVKVFSVFDMLSGGLRDVVDQTVARANEGTAGVHVSFDLDVLRESIVPGAALASSCGLDMREATYVCRRLGIECDIRSVDLIGLNPVRDNDFTTARIGIELLMILLGHDFSFGYHGYLRDQAR